MIADDTGDIRRRDDLKGASAAAERYRAHWTQSVRALVQPGPLRRSFLVGSLRYVSLGLTDSALGQSQGQRTMKIVLTVDVGQVAIAIVLILEFFK